MLLEPLMEADNLPDHGTLRTFLAPCLLVVASVLSLAGVSVAAANRLSSPPSCTRVSPPPRSNCP